MGDINGVLGFIRGARGVRGGLGNKSLYGNENFFTVLRFFVKNPKYPTISKISGYIADRIQTRFTEVWTILKNNSSLVDESLSQMFSKNIVKLSQNLIFTKCTYTPVLCLAFVQF